MDGAPRAGEREKCDCLTEILSIRVFILERGIDVDSFFTLFVTISAFCCITQALARFLELH